MSVPKWSELSRYTACDVADALLKLGVPGAGFLPDIVPIPRTSKSLAPDRKVVVAPASTILMAPKATTSFPSPVSLPKGFLESNVQDTTPYADLIVPGTVVIISQPPNQSCAVMGGIMAARMKVLGAQGIVVDGRIRDLSYLDKSELEVWSRGTSAVGAGAEAKFHAKDVTVRVGETVIEPGDIVIIDPFENGVVVVPKDKVGEVLVILPELVDADDKVLLDVEAGMSVKEAFKRHRNV